MLHEITYKGTDSRQPCLNHPLLVPPSACWQNLSHGISYQMNIGRKMSCSANKKRNRFILRDVDPQ
uniref:Uncharacterized protein n=1 Tax=Picea glauca TaxID=3330 RepID=A0A117NIC7_PICGL|nr:hypothetical protein ABT39_MTgene2987 [Picea glauca]